MVIAARSPLSADDAALLLFGLVAVALDHPAQDLFDAARARKGQGAAVLSRDRDLFVLGPDPPLLARLGPALEVADQLLAAFDSIGAH